MNIHPIIIHFPIALLVVYSLLEMVSIFSWKWVPSLKVTKQFLLFVWTIWVFFALQTWDLASDIWEYPKNLVHEHERRANISYILYIVLSVYYLLTFEFVQNLLQKVHKNIVPLIKKIQEQKYISIIVATLATLWIIALTITWALGGAISHWPDTDPIVKIIYNIFVK